MVRVRVRVQGVVSPGRVRREGLAVSVRVRVRVNVSVRVSVRVRVVSHLRAMGPG